MIPAEDFAWIKERKECSLASVFEMLRQQVKEDVRIRHGMVSDMANVGMPNRYTHAFKFIDSGNSFTVLLEGEQLNHRVCFSRESDRIKVTDTNGEQILEAIPSLNLKGECIMRIEKQDYPLWYMRLKTLEHLFFGIVQPQP